MAVDETSISRSWLALGNLVTQSRKARELNNDLRVTASHRGMNDILDNMEARLTEQTKVMTGPRTSATQTG